MSYRVEIGFSFASDWLRGWREFSKPLAERSKAKLMLSRGLLSIIALYTSLKSNVHYPINCVVSEKIHHLAPNRPAILGGGGEEEEEERGLKTER